jgi:hypothetical protein
MVTHFDIFIELEWVIEWVLIFIKKIVNSVIIDLKVRTSYNVHLALSLPNFVEKLSQRLYQNTLGLWIKVSVSGRVQSVSQLEL